MMFLSCCGQVSLSLRQSKVLSSMLLGIVLLSTSMILGDGVLTPAISVIGAVVGIQIAAPSITTGATPASCSVEISCHAAVFLDNKWSRNIIGSSQMTSCWKHSHSGHSTFFLEMRL